MNNPNLPQRKIKAAIVSPQYCCITDELKRLGINVIESIESVDLPYSERYHADMQVHNFSETLYFLRNSCSVLKNKLEALNPKANIIIEKACPSCKYPHNISLNGAFIGDKYICNIRHSNKELLRLYIENGVQIIDANQGYAKCSTAVVSHNAIITDDEAIFSKCNNQTDIDILKVSKGSVMLDGYDYGLIGGCCFKLDKNTLAFCGDYSKHSDFKNIKSFCKNHGVELIKLSNKPLLDIGGIVAII
ncbi:MULTISPECIES: DUF6873 family GME fold protein [unclassified Ruminococcus]|uniref:DUF6873 family GME fold protein n=1 Tax=unclassified Ruminococcus TaxID=2608920 RepID=UPI00210A4F7D|nr:MULTISPECIES: hypothetical protein [unclassified Ruminococcus]MCQ4022050.1 hypothetical protein [Ruminococcus sp. zg-924]MCQ4114370.1 hypothetical protein [Ruminococcus sp. zg-921]